MRTTCNKFSFVLSAVIVFVCETVNAEAPLKTFGADVLVGDIVSDCPKEICVLAVVKAPLPGRTRTVNKRDVEAAVRQAGMDPSTLRIPARVRVERPSEIAETKDLKTRIEEAVKAILPNGVVIEELGSISDVEVPKIGFEVKAHLPGDGRFQRRLSIPIDFISEGARFRTAQVSALLALEMDMPVTARDLMEGNIITEQDIRWKTLRLDREPATSAVTSREIIGRRVESFIAEGEPFLMRAVKRVPVIQEGEQLKLESVFGLVRVSALGVSRQEGAVGDRVRVVMSADNRLVWARVIGPGRAMVVP